MSEKRLTSIHKHSALLAVLAVCVLAVSAIGVAVAAGNTIFTPLSTNTVTKVAYPTTTTTATTTGTGGTSTNTVQPVEILTTTTVSGTQTYTTTTTQTVTGTATTTTTTASSDFYTPFYMYWTLSNNSGFYRQLTPILCHSERRHAH